MVIDNSGKGLASLGRAEDKFLAHVAPGERVVPPVISSDTQARLSKEMVAAGLDPDQYIVGPHMSINPVSGQPEFGWLKKTAKSLKKAVKKIATVDSEFTSTECPSCSKVDTDLSSCFSLLCFGVFFMLLEFSLLTSFLAGFLLLLLDILI